ncbi:hypothetical protein [Paludibacterium sp.]|nr:hypothetical protein [Paludibacterium sp.]MBV8648531.1 hypothetical protein [Paludibacterium sp.]
MKHLWRDFWAALQEAVRSYFAPRLDDPRLIRIECRQDDVYRRHSRRRY